MFVREKNRIVPLGTDDNSPPIYRWVRHFEINRSPVRDDRMKYAYTASNNKQID